MSFVKSKVLLLFIALTWGSLIMFMIPLEIISFAFDKVQKRGKKQGWLYSILIGQDCLVNAIFGGHFKTTISSELGYQSSKSDTARYMAKVVDWLFYVTVGEVDHCKNAMEKEDLYYVSGLRMSIGFICYVCGVYLIIV
uniref:hypothetical protein n=1 Tax=Ningiella ruwaisensis TaxID=2364274 RepID=UPI00109F6F6F|nr:hypothetical protein [Ningiella ruwaisensis]